MTLLDADFTVAKLANESPVFSETFSHELSLLNEKQDYLSRVDSIFDKYLECFPSECQLGP